MSGRDRIQQVFLSGTIMVSEYSVEKWTEREKGGAVYGLGRKAYLKK